MNLWLIPVGAAIGYLTNKIALKMIFRPKRRIKIGPLVIQGIIYKKRDQISKNLAGGMQQVLPWYLNLPVVSGIVRRGIERELNNHSVEELEKLMFDTARNEIRLIELYGALIGVIITLVVMVVAG